MQARVVYVRSMPGPLLPLERKLYMEAVYDVIAGSDEAARVLEAALGRLEQLTREVGVRGSRSGISLQPHIQGGSICR